MDEMVDFTEQATSETRDGSLSWLISVLQYPSYPAEVHAYGNVIGTGNAVVEWNLARVEA
jgi:2-aminophenol/2-amino-5-chlorophenol 1,6-dioxygenase beta subunit